MITSALVEMLDGAIAAIDVFFDLFRRRKPDVLCDLQDKMEMAMLEYAAEHKARYGSETHLAVLEVMRGNGMLNDEESITESVAWLVYGMDSLKRAVILANAEILLAKWKRPAS